MPRPSSPVTRAARALRDSDLGRKVSRYAAGSVISAGVSHGTFLLLYGADLLGAFAASVTAAVIAMIPGYNLNRRWAWQRRGRSGLWSEIVPYIAIVATAIAFTAFGTAALERQIDDLDVSRWVEVALVTLAFASVNGVAFVGKYLVLDRVLFRERASAE